MITNLQRDEAGTRGRLLTVASTTVDIDLCTGPDTFTTCSRIRFSAREPGATTFCEFVGAAVTSVTLNGRSLDPAEVWDGQRITLPGLGHDNDLTVAAEGTYSRSGEGLHRFVDTDGLVYLYSQFEAYDAHRMYPCFDQPDLKTTFTLTVTAPSEWKVISNGRTRQITVDGPHSRHAFAPTPQVSTYITALVAGPYHEVRDRHDGIDLGLFCRQAVAEFLDPEELLTVTRQGFDFFHAAFDYRYPFDKYDQLFVPEFNMGAMENAGCVTFLDDYVFRAKVTDDRRERRALTVLHEMAHMWFGDLVTMQWWDGLWLNESFAEYISTLAQVSATRWTNAWTTFANSEKWKAYRADQLPSTHPVAGDAPDIVTVLLNFDGITYGKGASILKQLVAWVGQEEFLAGLRSYFQRFAFANTALADLLACLEESSGRNLDDWARLWLETTGVNVLTPRFTLDPDGAFRTFEILQSGGPSDPTLRPHRIAVGIYDRDGDGRLVRTEQVHVDVVGAVTEVSKLIGVPRGELVLLNDDDLTYCKIRLDDRSLATLTSSLADLRDPLARALCWGAAFDLVRDAVLPARDYVRLVLAAIEAESDIGVVQTQLARLSLAAGTYADPATQDDLLDTVAAAAGRIMRSAPPGGERQLAYAQSWIATTRDLADIDVLAGLLASTTGIDGLAVDTDLRWRILIRLVTLGQAGEAQIAAEETRDATAFGAKRAATARAAVPSATAKEAVWDTVVVTDALSNHLRRAAVAGFAAREQAELLRPFRDRYFAALPGIWQSRGVEAASTVTSGLFPAVLVEADTLAAVDAFLADGGQHPSAVRMLREARATMERALAAQQRDRDAAAR